MEKWATDGRAEGGRESGRGDDGGEEELRRREEKRKRGKKGKFKMRGFLQSDVGRRSGGGKRGREGGGNGTRLLTGTFFSSPTFLSGYIIVK